MDGEYEWTYINGVVSILRKVMGDKTITDKETALVLDMLGVFGRNDLVHVYKGVKQYHKKNIRNYFERNAGRIKRFLFDIRPKPKPEEFEYKPYLQVNPMLKVPPREPSEMEIASNELLAADEVFYENNEHKNNITMNKTIKLNESELKSFINGTVKRILKESYDTDRQWKSELQAFMRGLRNGEAEISGDTVYVQIWKSRTASNDPRYVYYRRGENRLHDDHFYMQSSPRLSARTIGAINKHCGWSNGDEYDF